MMSLADAVAWREGLRSNGQTLVLTNGVFDILHVGHARYLAEARALGDALIVAIDSDASARALGKGPNRPVVAEADRAELVSALRSVDAVVIFDGPGAMDVIRALRPEIYVKGADYGDGSKPLPEAAVMAEIGGRVAFIALAPGRSTSAIVEKILRG